MINRLKVRITDNHESKFTISKAVSENLLAGLKNVFDV